MSYEDDLARLQRSLAASTQVNGNLHAATDGLHAEAHHKVAVFSSHLRELARRVAEQNPQLPTIECWSDEGGGYARVNGAQVVYRARLDQIPQPTALPRPWDLMRKGDHLHVMFFRNDHRLDDKELWLRIPLDGASAWVMTVLDVRDGGFEQPTRYEPRIVHSSADDWALAAECLKRLMKAAWSN